MQNRLLDLSRRHKKLVVQAMDAAAGLMSGLAVLIIVGDVGLSTTSTWQYLLLALVANHGALRLSGVYQRVLRYGLGDTLKILALALVAATIFMVVAAPVILSGIDAQLIMASQVGVIIAISFMRVILVSLMHANLRTGLPTAIYGAGQAGRILQSVMERGTKFDPVCYIDDDPEKQGTYIHGLKVSSAKDLVKEVQSLSIEQVFLAIEDISAARKSEILRSLADLDVKVSVAPLLEHAVLHGWTSGLDENIDYGRLLGREANIADLDLIAAMLNGQTILVTGAGGTIGSAICREVLKYSPKEIIMLDHSELGLFNETNKLRKMVEDEGLNIKVSACLANLCFKHSFETVFKESTVDFVFHAAAYKHVHLVEQNLVSGLHNNVLSCRNLIEVAGASKVKALVTISTDKAVKPTNIMGASKRVCELMALAANRRFPETSFSVVRFGNVLGSSGSVLPIFLDQLKSGGPLTVTDRRADRYVMLVPEAVHLVVKATLLASQKPEIFILEMGEPKNILDIAVKLIEAQGKVPVIEPAPDQELGEREVGIVFTGLKPGEKLSEELSSDGELKPTQFAKILSEPNAAVRPETCDAITSSIEAACEANDVNLLVKVLSDPAVGLQLDDSAMAIKVQN